MRPGPPSETSRAEVHTTLTNALKLGGSLFVTLVIGFGVRIALRRFLGPTVIGPINFADAFAATGFVFLGLGLDTYLRKVIPVTPERASEFLGAFLVVRALLALGTFGVMALILEWMGQPPAVRHLVWAFGAAQLFLSLNMTFTALLQSARTIDGLSVVNVASKLLWAAGFVATMAFGWPLIGIPLSVLAAEALKAVVGYALVRRHLKLRLSFDFSQVGPVFRASIAFYVNAVALVVVNRFDVSVLKVQANDTEIGLYSAASELAQMSFVMTPVMAGVVAPLFSRMLARSREEYAQVLRRTLEVVLTFAFPASLAILVGADLWVQVLLGGPYAPSAWALSILGPSFLLTYVATIVATALNLSGGEWTVTVTSVLGLVLNPLLVFGLVALSQGWGVGGGGAACAWAAILTEVVVLAGMLWRTGREAVDARLVKMVVKSALACAVVVAVDRLVFFGWGHPRVAVDLALYGVLVLASGALSPRETVAFLRTVRAQRSAS
ncbi:MAG: hypothetical protein AMXMBFR34_21660 [Myxococcaceae bacterium]